MNVHRPLFQSKSVPDTVLALGFVSFFTDLSSEMIYPLLPLFLSGVLGAGAVTLGVIEGIAESTSSLVKVVSGDLSDRFRKTKPFLLAGYGLAGLARPLIGLATAWPFVASMRFLDRLGKGIRTSPRDALIARVTAPEFRGRAYGVHRSMDHAGAVAGPLLAALLIHFLGIPLRSVFLLAFLPAIAVMIVLLGSVKENPGGNSRRLHRNVSWRLLGGNFKALLVCLLIFTLGNSSDAFLLLRLSQTGLGASLIAVLWSLHQVSRMVSSYTGGTLSDRFGPRPLVWMGWTIYAAVYLGFGFLESRLALVLVFLLYGVYYGLTEPAERVWVSKLVPAELRGTAFGLYHGVVGLAAFPASLPFGWIWQTWGTAAAFSTGSLLCLAASVMLAFVPGRCHG